MSPTFSVVIPTTGRPELRRLLDRLAEEGVTEPIEVVVDSDRLGPAHARNEGWRRASGEWVVFLDDDVMPRPGWRERLLADLDQPASVAAVQAQVTVPDGERTDWHATTAGLAHARWITADIAYRREMLLITGGFDENFPRAYREDADLAFRVRAAGGCLVVGSRATDHPVRPAGRWVSLRSQRGNADDAYLRRRYGSGWHGLLEVPHGRRRRHTVTTLLGLTSLGLFATRRYAWATVAAAAWAGATADFVAHRLRAAPAERRQPLPLIATSVAIPPLAVGHWLAGWWRHRRVPNWPATGVRSEQK
ncbi:MAG: glycosyltransferase [Hamadaea sp.]|nr:glycosyltransferase [Hamadaea sp.]NUT08783.1 glycosyltransferase [Hamadaea sp.]